MSARRTVITLVLMGLALGLGVGIGLRWHGGAKETAGPGNVRPKILYWTSPMDTSQHYDHPGKGTMGMKLIPVYAKGAKDNSDVRISPTVVNNLGVRTAEVKRGTLAHLIATVGYVGYNQDTMVSINTRAAGWVERLAVKTEGDRVRAGQLLYELFSPKLATAEREYLTARAGGGKDLIDASRERLRALGFTAAQIKRLARSGRIRDRVARRADGPAVLTSLGVREGAYVTPATTVMHLAELSSVWILVEVNESDAALIARGQKAVATLDAFPDHEWKGKVDYIYPEINPVTRTARVRLRFANPGEKLQPNMFAHVALLAAPSRDAVYVPTQAVIRTGMTQRVIVALGAGRFDVCPVKTGLQSGGKVQILKGLEPGQRIVVSAQFMLDSEANMDAATVRLGSNKPGCRAAPPSGGDKQPGKQP